MIIFLICCENSTFLCTSGDSRGVCVCVSQQDELLFNERHCSIVSLNSCLAQVSPPLTPVELFEPVAHVEVVHLGVFFFCLLYITKN